MSKPILVDYLKLADVNQYLGEEYSVTLLLQKAECAKLTIYWKIPLAKKETISNETVEHLNQAGMIYIGSASFLPLTATDAEFFLSLGEERLITPRLTVEINDDTYDPLRRFLSDDLQAKRQKQRLALQKFTEVTISKNDLFVLTKDLTTLSNMLNQQDAEQLKKNYSKEWAQLGPEAEMHTMRALGLMAILLSKALQKYKKGDSPNSSAIRKAVRELAENELGLNPHGLSQLNQKIGVALERIEEEIKGNPQSK